MTDHLYDALEICLQALEKGANVETCLARFPALAEELRPILETASQARAHAVQEVPADALRRGRTRVLQYAAELREQRQAAVPFWRKLFQPGRALRTMATSLTAVVFVFSGGTGLVFASSNSLPGDNLYPLKRSWEGVQLAFTLDPAAKSQRQIEFEQERVHEIHELFSESRKTQVDFQGVVQTQQPDVWQIAGLKIAIDNDATIDARILPGTVVWVIGETEDGIIQAEQIILIQAPSSSPTPAPQQTQALRPTQAQEPTDEATEPRSAVEPGQTENPDIETPEPPSAEIHKAEPTEKRQGGDGGDSGNEGDGGSDS